MCSSDLFNSGNIKEVKISQFSTNPNKVRVLMYYDKGFNPSNIKFTRIKNNIIIRLKNDAITNANYFQNTYRDEHSSSSDFYEYLTIDVYKRQVYLPNRMRSPDLPNLA